MKKNIDKAASYAGEKSRSWKMFNTLAARYDKANRMLSMGLDLWWRRKAAGYAPAKDGLHVVDVATGTGDFIIAFEAIEERVERFIGIDLAQHMLDRAAKKFLAYENLYPKTSLRLADAVDIPLDDDGIDLVTIGFGIRNIANTMAALKEMHRILKKNGMLMVLEFSLPKNFFHRVLFVGYLRVAVPLIGGLITGRFRSYYYLTKTIEAFPCNEDFLQLMKEAGFHRCSQKTFFPGGISLYSGYKV